MFTCIRITVKRDISNYYNVNCLHHIISKESVKLRNKIQLEQHTY